MPTTSSQELYERARQLASDLGSMPEIQRKMYALARAIHPCRHSPDFAGVVWYGVHHTFNRAQAAIVKLLWEAWEDGTLDVCRDTLIHAATGNHRTNLSDIFRGKSAWGTMIQEVSKGIYRMVEPEKNPEKPQDT